MNAVPNSTESVLAGKPRLCQEGRVQNDVRAVLQYVPQFRGRLFVVLIEAGKLPESAVAECLLDLAALEDVGVKLVLVVLGGDVKDFYDWGLECEIKVAMAKQRIDSPSLAQEARDSGFIVLQLFAQHLQGHSAMGGMIGTKNGSSTAFANLPTHRVPGKSRPD